MIIPQTLSVILPPHTCLYMNGSIHMCFFMDTFKTLLKHFFFKSYPFFYLPSPSLIFQQPMLNLVWILPYPLICPRIHIQMKLASHCQNGSYNIYFFSFSMNNIVETLVSVNLFFFMATSYSMAQMFRDLNIIQLWTLPSSLDTINISALNTFVDSTSECFCLLLRNNFLLVRWLGWRECIFECLK